MDESHLEMQKPRRVVKSFIAKFGGTCDKCFLGIVPGQRVRYNQDDRLIHHAHKQIQGKEEVCGSCFLVKPCECD